MNIASTIILYVTNTIASISIALLYVLIFMAFCCFFLANFNPRMFIVRWQELSKSLFCSTIQALTLFSMFFALVLLHALGYGLFSAPFILDELLCILILIFSVIFALSKPTRFSWLWAILLFLFSSLILRSAIQIILANTRFLQLPSSESFRTAIAIGIVLSLTLVQMISMAIFEKNYFKQGIGKIIKLMVVIFISHVVTILLVDIISMHIDDYIRMHTPRTVTRSSQEVSKEIFDSVTSKKNFNGELK